MTIGIIESLKSKKISRDWQVTCDSLKATVDSILAQSDSDYKVVVVGHDCPDFLAAMNDSKIKFVAATFEAPDRSSPAFTTQYLINDKTSKIISCLYEMRNESLYYVYQLDSDDLIHKDFVKKIKLIKNTSAIILESGYLYYKSSNRYIETAELDQVCGSTVVVASNAFVFPTEINISLIHDIPWTKYRYMNIYKFFELDTKQPYIRLNEKLVTYVLASGDNFSDGWRDSWSKKLKWKLKPYLQGSKVSVEFKNNFLG
jgi:hypothetical protein